MPEHFLARHNNKESGNVVLLAECLILVFPPSNECPISLADDFISLRNKHGID